MFALGSYVPLFLLLTLTGVLPTHLGIASIREILLQALFQGVFVVAVAGITFVTMVQAFGPVRSAMITALVPGLSALGAALLLGEPLSWNLLAGLALVTAGILFGVRAVRPNTPDSIASGARAASAGGQNHP